MRARCLLISCVSRHDRSVRSARLVGQASLDSRRGATSARVSRAVDHRELPRRPGAARCLGCPRCHDRPRQAPRPPARTGQAAAHSANTSRNGRERGPVLCYSRWVNITELVIFHRSAGFKSPSDTQGYRQNCRCHTDRTVAVTCFLVWRRALTPALVAVRPGREWRRACCGCCGLAWGVADLPGCWYRGGGGCLCVSAVGEVVAQAGPAPPCPAGDAGLVAGGEGPPGADLADVGGHEQQRGEDRLGGDAADAAPGGLGEGFVGGVFDVAR